MKILIIIYIVFYNTALMAQEYEILSVHSLLDILKNQKQLVLSEEQLEYNKSFVYRLKGDRIVLIPEIGGEGILFHSLDAYQEMVKNHQFPVQDEGSIFEQERGKIKNIQENIPYFITLLSEKLKVPIVLSDEIYYLSNLTYKIRDYLAKDSLDNIILPLKIFMGELLRRRIHGKWELEKVYTLNPYWIPYVTDSKNQTYLMKVLDNKLQGPESEQYTLVECLYEMSKPLEEFDHFDVVTDQEDDF